MAWFCLPHLSTYTFCKPFLLIFLKNQFLFFSKIQSCGRCPLWPCSLWMLKVPMRGLALRSALLSSTVMYAGFLSVSPNNPKRWTRTLMSCRLCSQMSPIWWQCGVTCISYRDTHVHRQRLHLPISRSSILISFSKWLRATLFLLLLSLCAALCLHISSRIICLLFWPLSAA